MCLQSSQSLNYLQQILQRYGITQTQQLLVEVLKPFALSVDESFEAEELNQAELYAVLLNMEQFTNATEGAYN
jgi:FMN-dependent NADH-azoreductase